MNNKDVVPVIVNGELNMGSNKPSSPKKEKNDDSKFPKKRFGLSDVLLSILGIALIIYGVSNFSKSKDKNEKKEDFTPNTEVKSKEMNPNDAFAYVNLSLDEENIYSQADLEKMLVGLNANELSNNAKLSLAARITQKNQYSDGTYMLDSALDESMKKIFGNIEYSKSAFTYLNQNYVYNQETKNYYLLSEQAKQTLNYKKYIYTENEENDNTLIIREYVAYSDGQKGWTLNNKPLSLIITDVNIKQNYSILSYYEYEFTKDNGNYYLKKISLK